MPQFSWRDTLPSGDIWVEDSAEREAWTMIFAVPAEPAWRIERPDGRVVHVVGGTAWMPSAHGTYRMRVA